MTTPRAAIYARISLDRTGEGLGVERQETDARKLAETRGWEVAEVIVENSVSAAGGKKQRAGFDRLLELVESGQVQVVVAWALDRLTRNRRDTVRLIETCQKHRVLIALCRGSDLDMASAPGRMTADILAAVARGEIETKSDRQKSAAEQARMAGRWFGGPRPFGYQIVTAPGSNRRTLAIDETEADALRDAFQLILDGGSLREVARRFNEAGLATPQGSRWTGTVLSRTLRRPSLAGLRGVARGAEDHRNDSHEQVMRHPDGSPVRAEWEPIVDVETWRAAQTIFRNPDRKVTVGSQLLLTGIAKCGRCDGGIHSAGRRRGKTGGSYRCATGASHVNRLSDPVDAWVTQAVLYRLEQPDAKELLVPKDDGAAAAKVRDEIRTVEQLSAGLLDLYADGTITAVELKQQRQRFGERLGRLQDQLPRVSNRSRDLAALVTSDDVRTVWDGLGTGARRDIIDALASVTLYPPGKGVAKVKPEHVVIEWR